jgi:DNA-directed RNA polymerase subunit M/transcription elongation factor TFIIS
MSVNEPANSPAPSGKEATATWTWSNPREGSLSHKQCQWNSLPSRLHVFRQLIESVSADGTGPEEGSILSYMWKLEREMLLFSRGNCTAYMHKACQTQYMLSQKGVKAIMAEFPDATQLAWMDEQHVLPTSFTELCKQRCLEKWHTASQLCQIKLEVPEDLQGGMCCRKCKSHNLNVEMRQTRSADEGMTAFITCQQCGHRW